jgi:transposase
MAKRPNPNLAKIHRNYTLEEVANLFSVHKNTVRLWVKGGLATVNGQQN